MSFFFFFFFFNFIAFQRKKNPILVASNSKDIKQVEEILITEKKKNIYIYISYHILYNKSWVRNCGYVRHIDALTVWMENVPPHLHHVIITDFG